MNTRLILRASGLLLAAGLASTARAHDAWVQPQDGQLVFLFGHAGKLEAATAAKVSALAAVNAAGQPLAARLVPTSGAPRVQVDGTPAVITSSYDNGFHSRTKEGSKPGPMNEVPGALGASHAVKFGKTVLAWGAPALKPVGQTLEIVPLAAPAGGAVTVQVLVQGQPLAGAKVSRFTTDTVAPVVTDARGQARVPVPPGVQMISVAHRQPLTGDARADVLSMEANLVLAAP
ncbi:MAG: DUF4198 domain-containing protein [Burkholderiales bacterium]|jgi:nickel transport protein|nr:DUF4198 domain-containing protein [Burkholderiales bacterium]